MVLKSVQANRLCELLGNRSSPSYPDGASSSEKPSVEPILAAAMFLCATKVARSNNMTPPAANALADFVLSKVTSSLGFLDIDRVFDLSSSRDGTHLLHFKSPVGTTEAVVFIPSLSDQQNLSAPDAAIFEVGVVLDVFVQCLKFPLRPLSSKEAITELSGRGKLFLNGVNLLLSEHKEALAIVGAMVNNAVPWAIVTGETQSRESLQQVINGGTNFHSTDECATLAYRHLLQTAVVTDFVVTALNEYIDKGHPIPDHEAVTDAVMNANPNWIVEPARSMLLETVAYSSNRTAKYCKSPRESIVHWMHGAKFAWRGLMSSRIPRQAKYVAENLAQASKVASEPFGKKCADAIFCSAYTLGHFYACMGITADELQLKPQEGADTTTFRCNDDWLNEWEAIPAYNDDPFFVQRFMADGLKVTQDNLVVNMLAGSILLEQFLRDSPIKRCQMEDIKQVNLLTAYMQQPESVLHFEDRPLLFTEPFLWAYQIFRLALSQGEEGATAVTNCGYSSLPTKTAYVVSSLLQSATSPAESRVSSSLAECLPSLVQLLNYLAGRCPENSNERSYLISLSSDLRNVSFIQ